MSLNGKVRAILQGGDQVAFRPSQTYSSVTGAYTIFTVAGGPILARYLIGGITGAPGGATTIAGTLNGVAGDAGAADIGTTGIAGWVVWYPLNVAGTTLVAAALPMTIATAPQGMIVGTSVGTIVITYAVSTIPMSWTLVYKKLSPASHVV
jgi:hypothetical protein